MKQFIEEVKNNFKNLTNTGKLFRVNAPHLFNEYLAAFEPGTDNTFRDPTSSEHNCNTCHNFIRRYGNIVALDENNEIITLFSNLNVDEPYKVVAERLDYILKNSPIVNVFFETFTELNSLPYERCNMMQPLYRLGIDKNYKQYTVEEAAKFGVVNSKEVYTFDHFHLDLPTVFVDKTGKSIESIMATYRDKYSVFKRTMEEIPLDTLYLARDLINQGSLLDGTSHLGALNNIIEYVKKRDDSNLDKWCWKVTYDMSESIAKWKNTLMGTFCTELAEGKELNKTCEDWNKRVDPVNYHKAKSPITKKQIEEAKKFVQENGYEESFNRRLATLDDIKASEILHINRDVNKSQPVSIFDTVKSTSTRHKRSEFDKIEEVHIDKFMKDILPTCTGLEVYFENRMEGNLCNITTPVNKDSKPIFKWNNNYSYTFNGNLAGKSMIKEAVKQAGGKVDGVLRFSISWNEDGKSIVDFDAHAIEPDRTEIYYSNKKSYKTGGFLDVDMIRPAGMGVENITWLNKSKMPDGKYVFFNRNFDSRPNTGFKAEIEFDGEIFNYEYNGNAQNDIKVATVTLNKGVFTIEHHLPETTSSKEIWNIETNEFHKVNLVCLSPNHWEDNEVGNKYYMFMIEKCKNPNQVRGFHNEHLIADLLNHRKVMDVLGNSVLIEPTNKQLAGIGFNSTVRDELIVKLSGSFKRMIKLKF